MESAARGEKLLKGSRRVNSRAGFLSRLLAPNLDTLFHRFDAGIDAGVLRLALPDGSQRMLGGRSPGFDSELAIRDWRALWRISRAGSVGFYQAWEAGELECPDLVSLFALISANSTSLGDTGRAQGLWRWLGKLWHSFNKNTRKQAERNIHAHYDLGNDFYGAWLDPTMSYSSGYRFDDGGLEASQHRKWERLATRLGNPQSVLEIGCGWGSLAAYFAGRGAQVTALSLSDEQLAWARQRYGDSIDFRHQDYRDVEGQFDAIVSVEMVEAVGREYWPSYFDCIARCLKPGGKAALQWISMRDDLFEGYARNADFIQAYIFPGGLLIKEADFRRLAAERGLSWEDQEDFPLDYADTLKAWRENFDLAVKEKRLPDGFDDRFIRLWRFYLEYCEGGFRGGGISVGQATLAKRK